MESLFKLQINKQSVIEKARSNFKKSPKDRISRAYILTRLEALEQTWSSFLCTHNEIIQKAKDSTHEYFTDETYDYTEELYINYKSELKELLDNISSTSSAKSASSAKSVQSENLKLPKISIPKFSGHYAEWPTFKDLFLSLIHNNESLDSVQRLHYLKGLLSGEAEQLLRHIPVTASNYQECWSLLKGRYDNKRFQSNCLLRRLMSQTTVSETSSAIKGLLDTTMECLNGLKNLGIDVSTWDILVIYIISAKLDPESRKLWETQISSLIELPKFPQFKDFLEARFRALEFLDDKSAKFKSNVNVSNKPKVHHVVNAESTANVTNPCAFCKEMHKIGNCKSFAKESYEKRHSFVQSNGLCFNCLNANHSVKFCRQTTSCRICKRKHHSLLHPKTVSSNAVVNVHQESTASQSATTVGETTSNVVSHFSRESVSTQVLLATALVKAQTRLGSTQLLRVLLDQGSQACFITESAVQLLGLKKMPTKSLISGIGGERGTLASEYTVSVTIHSHLDHKFSVNINAYVLSNITSLLPSVQVSPSNWPELEAICLADPAFHTPNKIDILLGAEVYGQILRDGLIQGPPGVPVAQNTALGWILSGKVSSTSDTVSCHQVVVCHSNQVDENAILKQFWEIESVIPGTQKKDFYVDDLMTGCQTVQEGVKIHKQMTDILTKGGFQLSKWVSSCNDLNREISYEGKGDWKSMKEEQERNKDINGNEVIKILGIAWDRKRDEFKYSVNLPPQQSPITKRKVISDISRLFDPLGWAAPCVVTSKIFIQKLWISGIGWDDELTSELMSEWQTYRKNLVETCRFSVPRWVHMKNDDVSVELHGFCDASIFAYSAVVYLRIVDARNDVQISLVTARTKVAPVKQQSIPRLELMGAVLLAELIVEVADVMKIQLGSVHLWTDSSVVLAWLSGHPSRWTTFVGNRVSTILSQCDNTHWAHVQSSHNPADIASRGITPQELAGNVLWVQGPSWLKNKTIEYKRPKSIATSEELRSVKSHVAIDTNPEDPIWTRFSKLSKLVRVIAYCKRILKWKQSNKEKKRYEICLQNEELVEAMNICIKNVQNQEFSEEISDIKRIGHVKARSKLKSLCPFIDDNGILRVSGRLNKSNLEFSTKCPVILPHSNHFTSLIISEAHEKTLHGGPTLMLSQLRTGYWIISAKSLVKAYVRNCVRCRRYSASTQTQIMGQLPSCRVTPARPFRHSGVDFAGPISVRTSKGRGHHSYKGYICIFVCIVSKASHLEIISDLSATGFIAGFKRFVARRGHVTDLWSDNGTNFVGAARELRHLVALEQSSVAVEIREWIGNNGTTWHFIPPHAPNFGGLWEAGVKSTKGHLRRVIGDSTLTYEEMATVLTQIEACLNSRPLSMLSDDPADPTPLTPGHFLVGEPLITVPKRNYEDSNVSSLRRWQVTQRMVQTFWRRWSTEYLTHLLQRHKWTKHVPEPSVGDVVLVKEDGLPPARWLMGRVVSKHPGQDQMTRVVTLRCNGSLIKRPTSKVCILPVSQ